MSIGREHALGGRIYRQIEDPPVTHRPARELSACYHIYQFCELLVDWLRGGTLLPPGARNLSLSLFDGMVTPGGRNFSCGSGLPLKLGPIFADRSL